MTKEEYDKTKLTFENEHSKNIKSLGRKYAISNSTVKKGDILRDHSGIIEVDNIKWGFSYMSKYPMCIYSGIKLRKDLKPYKSGERDTLYQSNLTEVKNDIKNNPIPSKQEPG